MKTCSTPNCIIPPEVSDDHSCNKKRILLTELLLGLVHSCNVMIVNIAFWSIAQYTELQCKVIWMKSEKQKILIWNNWIITIVAYGQCKNVQIKEVVVVISRINSIAINRHRQVMRFQFPLNWYSYSMFNTPICGQLLDEQCSILYLIKANTILYLNNIFVQRKKSNELILIWTTESTQKYWYLFQINMIAVAVYRKYRCWWPWRMFSYICLLSYIVVVSDWLLHFGISRFVFKAFWQYVRIPLICTNITINCSIRLFRIHTEVTKWFLRNIRLLWEILYTCKYPPVVGASSIVHSIAIPPETGDTSSNNAREYRQKSTINIFLYFIFFFASSILFKAQSYVYCSSCVLCW